VSLSLRADGERAFVRVRDTGPGIPPDVLPTIFEPFTQGKQTLLPLASAGRTREARSAGRNDTAEPTTARRRVFVIDDNHDAAETLAELIEMLGHTPVVAYDAFAGLASASEELPDVVLCDIGLPDIDGYEFARQFRAIPSSDAVRLVALSGYAQPEDVTRATEAGFDVHVAKPPAPEKLAALLG
jgi:CheY-like chemotaxis protein